MASPGNNGYNPSAYHAQVWAVQLDVNGNPLTPLSLANFNAAFPAAGIATGGFNATSGQMKPLKINDDGTLATSASVTASIAAFKPTGHATKAIATSSSNVAFPSADTSAVIRNTGTVDAYFNLGSSGVTAATTDYLLKAGDWICLDRTGSTHIAGITGASSSSLEIWTGTGLVILSQGGSSGGGGGNVNLNQVGGAAYSLGQNTMANSMPVVLASNQSAVPTSLASLPAFAAIPTFKIDQTTNGVTNAVDILNMPVTLDTNAGNLSASTIRVCLATNSAAIANWGHGATAAAVPGNATYVGMNVGGNLVGLTGTANGLKVDGSAVTQPVSGVFWQATQPVSLASQPLPTGAATETTLNSNLTQTTNVNTVLGVKTDAKATQTDATSVSAISIWKQISFSVQAIATSIAAALTANPSDVTPIIADNTIALKLIIGAACKWMSYYWYNPGAAVAYVQVFDAASTGAVTLGTTVPKWSIAIPPASAANLSGLNIAMANGIVVAVTTGAKNSTAIGTACDGNMGYR